MLVPAHLCAVAAHVLKVGCVWMPFPVNPAVLFVHLTTLLMTFPLSDFCFFSSFHPTPSQSSHLLYQHLCTCASLLSFLTPVPPPPPPLQLTRSRFLALFHAHLFALSPPPHVSQVDWPMNIIITDSCMNKYNRLFSFLLQLKHMVWSLREVWFHLKRTGEGVWAGGVGGLLIGGPARPTPYL